MSSILDHLSKDTLPETLIKEFVRWCVWEQARPAFSLVLNKGTVTDIADAVESAENLAELVEIGEKANEYAKSMRGRTGPLGLSAIEATAFEFTNMIRAAGENWDPEGVAFFASRVCGWAGWASTDFADPMQKAVAEKQARAHQEAQLQKLWSKNASG